MDLLNKITKYFENIENRMMAILSLFLFINSFFYLSKKSIFGTFPKISANSDLVLFIYLVLFVCFIGTIFYFSEIFSWRKTLKKILITFSFSEALFIFAIHKLVPLSGIVIAIAAFYIFLLLFYLVTLKNKEEEVELSSKIKAYFSRKNLPEISIIILVLGANLIFGLYHIEKFAAVDEPLWLFSRIPNFWDNVEDRDWKNAKVSDKPGLTVALASGPGLFFENNPKQYKNEYAGVGDVKKNVEHAESLNLIFRIPFYLFAWIMLPFFYFILKGYIGKKAALSSFIFIGLSPILIGNTQIINPDGLLWIFSSLSIIAYLSHISSGRRLLLVLSAIFLGLAILTKYTATILYVFFLFLIFGEYIINYAKHTSITAHQYLRNSFKNYALLAAISLCVIFVLYPTIWATPEKLLLLTINSQPFEPIFPVFSFLITLIYVDTFILKNFILSRLLKIFVATRKIIIFSLLLAFLACVLLVLVNAYNGMRLYNFEDIIASPKSAFHMVSFLGLFLTNFYALVFGASPIAIVLLAAYLSISIFKKIPINNNFMAVIFIISFIFVYYAGSVFSNVVATIRYQIMLYPLIFIASGIAFAELVNILSKNSVIRDKIIRNYFIEKYSVFLINGSLAVILIITLIKISPFNMGYSSILLPKNHFLDVKDMGEGNYEAANFLNSLDNAKKVIIWTDKKGVCTFFVGKCYSGFDKKLSQIPYDYFVVSSGRNSRSSNMEAYWKYFNINFFELYKMENASFKLEINGRPGNFVKIINANAAPEYTSWILK